MKMAANPPLTPEPRLLSEAGDLGASELSSEFRVSLRALKGQKNKSLELIDFLAVDYYDCFLGVEFVFKDVVAVVVAATVVGIA